MEIYYKIKDIIEEEMGFDSIEITPYSNVKTDLHLDSIDFVELTVLIEREFNILLEDDLCHKIYTVSDFCYATRLKLNN